MVEKVASSPKIGQSPVYYLSIVASKNKNLASDGGVYNC